MSTPKPTGLPESMADAVQAVGGGLADIVEVRCTSADDHAEGDDRVEMRCQPGGGDGQLEAAGHTDERGVGSGFGGGALGSVDESVHDLRVPGSGDDGDAQVSGVDGEFWCSGMSHE